MPKRKRMEHDMQEIEKIKLELDLLQTKIEAGCEIKEQEGRWYLFDRDGEAMAGGDTVREMIINLIFTDC